MPLHLVLGIAHVIGYVCKQLTRTEHYAQGSPIMVSIGGCCPGHPTLVTQPWSPNQPGHCELWEGGVHAVCCAWGVGLGSGCLGMSR